MLKRELQEPHEEATKKRLTRKSIATDTEIRRLLQKLQGQDLLWMVLMVITGRRAIDIGRMKYEQVKLYGKKVGVIIPKDKVSKQPVSFSFEWKEFDVAGFDIIQVKKQFEENCKNRTGFVIESENQSKPRHQNLTIMKQRISRQAKFNIHALRSRRAVICLMSGRSESLVKAKIGWKSEVMVRYYTILSADQICEFKSYSSFCKYLLSQIEHMNI